MAVQSRLSSKVVAGVADAALETCRLPAWTTTLYVQDGEDRV